MQMHEIFRQNPEIRRLFTYAEMCSETFSDDRDRFPHDVNNHVSPLSPGPHAASPSTGLPPRGPDIQPFAVCLTRVSTGFTGSRSQGVMHCGP
ncbi:hypothetical protein MchiMG62_08110 [Methanoculleus chikugoensis]|uniref:Uncharacterized protein n=1 Tax=Methanoculleus chikugoensis TaxID=118126 RepID=A0ABN5XFS7_9EURY|nr:hypothetical protein MchiMG62_08110 [Methanoculleus chikugoensis]